MTRYLIVAALFLTMLSCSSSDDDPKPATDDDLEQQALDMEAESVIQLLPGNWKVTGFTKVVDGKDSVYSVASCYEAGTEEHLLINSAYEFKASGSAVITHTCGETGSLIGTWKLARGPEEGSVETKAHTLFLKQDSYYVYNYTYVEVLNNNKFLLKQYDESSDSFYRTITIEKI